MSKAFEDAARLPSPQRFGGMLFVIDKKICFGNCVAGNTDKCLDGAEQKLGARQDDITGRKR
jgi:hypothetical protein